MTTLLKKYLITCIHSSGAKVIVIKEDTVTRDERNGKCYLDTFNPQNPSFNEYEGDGNTFFKSSEFTSFSFQVTATRLVSMSEWEMLRW